MLTINFSPTYRLFVPSTVCADNENMVVRVLNVYFSEIGFSTTRRKFSSRVPMIEGIFVLLIRWKHNRNERRCLRVIFLIVLVTRNSEQNGVKYDVFELNIIPCEWVLCGCLSFGKNVSATETLVNKVIFIEF